MTQPELGMRLRQLRRKQGLGQADLAEVGISVSYVSLLEAGKREPTGAVVAALAAKLGVEPSELTARPVREDVRQEVGLVGAEQALRLGHTQEAVAQFEELLALEHLDDWSRWRAERGLAESFERQGDLEAAIERYEAMREKAEAHPDRRPWLNVVIGLTACYRDAGDLARSIDVAEAALEVARSLGLASSGEAARLIVTLAGCYRERGDLARASQLLSATLQGLGFDASATDRGSALWNAAVVAGEQGRHGDAHLLAERAAGLFAATDDARSVALLRVVMAWTVLESAGDSAQARALLLQARDALIGIGCWVDVAYAETELSRAELELGDVDDAIRWARSSLERLQGSDRLECARARVALAGALFARGDRDQARQEMLEAATLLEEGSASRQAASVWRDLADLETAAGDGDAAASALRNALSLLGVQTRNSPRRTMF